MRHLSAQSGFLRIRLDGVLVAYNYKLGRLYLLYLSDRIYLPPPPVARFGLVSLHVSIVTTVKWWALPQSTARGLPLMYKTRDLDGLVISSFSRQTSAALAHRRTAPSVRPSFCSPVRPCFVRFSVRYQKQRLGWASTTILNVPRELISPTTAGDRGGRRADKRAQGRPDLVTSGRHTIGEV